MNEKPQATLWDQPMDPAARAPVRAAPRILRVSDLNRRVRQLLDVDSQLADVWVEGEVSQPSFPPSGHCFFTLKDASSQIKAVLFREESGLLVPHAMEAIWHLEGGDLPVIRFTLERFEYDVAEPF